MTNTGDSAQYQVLDERPQMHHEAVRNLPGVLADSMDRYDLMRGIAECDRAIEALMQIRAIHTRNLCRIANRAVFELEATDGA